MVEQPTISTHVLDTGSGRPAAGLAVTLRRVDASGEVVVGSATTDADGRVRRLLDGQLAAGEYRLEFTLDTTFYARMSVTFRVSDVTRSYHLPLLLSPYSLTTYRGS